MELALLVQTIVDTNINGVDLKYYRMGITNVRCLSLEQLIDYLLSDNLTREFSCV